MIKGVLGSFLFVLFHIIYLFLLFVYSCKTKPPLVSSPPLSPTTKTLSVDRITLLTNKSGHQFFIHETQNHIAYWNPTTKHIPAVLSATYHLLQTSPSTENLQERLFSQIHFSAFKLQIVGVIRMQQKLLFCNYFYDPSPNIGDYDWKLLPRLPLGPHGKINKCFQLYYNLQTKTCSELSFYGKW